MSRAMVVGGVLALLLPLHPGNADAQRTPVPEARFTPFTLVPIGDYADCWALNASPQNRTVHIQFISYTGMVVVDLGNKVLQPGTADGGGNVTANFGYCKFTVLDGTKADIRGSMTLCTATALCKQTISAE